MPSVPQFGIHRDRANSRVAINYAGDPGAYVDASGLTVPSGETLEVGGTFTIGGTAVTATAAEINRAADVSARIVNCTAGTLAVDIATHDGKIVTLNKADGITATLPAATGSGAVFTFVVGTAASGGSYVITVTGDDTMKGICLGADTDGGGATGYTWPTASNTDTITSAGTANGGKVGDKWVLIDVAADVYNVFGTIGQSGGSEATPFSGS